MSQKTIAIVGSRPGAVHCDADVTYFINGSIEHRHNYSQSLNHNHIIAGNGLLKRYSMQTGHEDDWSTQWMNAFRDGRSDHTIIQGMCDIDNVIKTLALYNYKAGNIEKITISQGRKIAKDVLGHTPPFGFRYGLSYGVKNGLYLYANILKTFTKYTVIRCIRYKRSAMATGWSAYFLPSNGMMALLHAMQSYGMNNKFRLVGIGLTPNEYGYNFKKKRLYKDVLLRNHLLGDSYVIGKVSRLIDIETDDEFIASHFQIPLLR